MIDRRRLLLVDDEPLALRRLALTLKGYDDLEVIGEASDGGAALAESRR